MSGSIVKSDASFCTNRRRARTDFFRVTPRLRQVSSLFTQEGIVDF